MGLLFAGSSNTTIANPIGDVLTSLADLVPAATLSVDGSN